MTHDVCFRTQHRFISPPATHPASSCVSAHYPSPVSLSPHVPPYFCAGAAADRSPLSPVCFPRIFYCCTHVRPFSQALRRDIGRIFFVPGFFSLLLLEPRSARELGCVVLYASSCSFPSFMEEWTEVKYLAIYR
jgi:hypothetical protein